MAFKLFNDNTNASKGTPLNEIYGSIGNNNVKQSDSMEINEDEYIKEGLMFNKMNDPNDHSKFSIDSIQLPFKSISLVIIVYLVILVLLLCGNIMQLLIYYLCVQYCTAYHKHDLLVYILIPFCCYILSLVGIYLINKQKNILTKNGYLEFPHKINYLQKRLLMLISIWFPIVWTIFFVAFEVSIREAMMELNDEYDDIIYIVTLTLMILGDSIEIIFIIYILKKFIKHNKNKIKPETITHNLFSDYKVSSINKNKKNHENYQNIIEKQGNKIRFLNKQLCLTSKELLKQKTINENKICLKCNEYKEINFKKLIKYKTLLHEQKKLNDALLNEKNLLTSEFESKKIELINKENEVKQQNISLKNLKLNIKKNLNEINSLRMKLIKSQNEIKKMKIYLKIQANIDTNNIDLI